MPSAGAAAGASAAGAAGASAAGAAGALSVVAAGGAAVGVQERGLAPGHVEVAGDDFEQGIFLQAAHAWRDANSCEAHLN